MIKLLVIADDFTGALDTGVQFSNQGTQTLVSTKADIDYQNIPDNIEVLVLNTDSRHLSFAAAYSKIRDIILQIQTEDIPYIYKKVDSALRGNISAEMKALIDYSEQDSIPFLPAYPEMNRVLIEGHLYIDDILVTETVFANDPYEPVVESNISKRLETEADIHSTLLNENCVPKARNEVLVFDAQTNNQLERQATLLKNENLLSLTVGCAGFAKVLAQKIFPNRKTQHNNLKKPIVVICGSVNPITKKQIAYAEQKSYPRISLSGKQLIELDHWETVEGQLAISEFLELVNNNTLTIFETFSTKTHEEIAQLREKLGLTYTECRFRIGESLGNLTKLLWTHHIKKTFLFTGGDTLLQSMKVLDISSVKPESELSPGVVLSTIEWQNKKIQVITKSGGFGAENVLEQLII